jgi:hypothetical protein
MAAEAGREDTLALVARVAAVTTFYRGVLALAAAVAAVVAKEETLFRSLRDMVVAALGILVRVPVEPPVLQMELAAPWVQHPPARRGQRLGLVEREI